MIILGIEFFALIAICYLFLVYASRDKLGKGEKKPVSNWIIGTLVMIPVVMLMFISWYMRIEMAQ